MPEMSWKNKLYFGDNLNILAHQIDDESVDLIYLDPPFNSNATYNVLFSDKSGQKSAAQIAAFEDTWQWSAEESEAAYSDVIHEGGPLADLLSALRQFLGTNNMMAYLVMMAVRLKHLHRVLKSTGSLYLHCDPTASHYLKLILDAIFGAEMYRNEIVWKRTTTHNDSKTWSRVADVIFFYTKSKTFTWNTPRQQHSEEYVATKYRYDDGDGRLYRLDNMTSPNPRPNMMYEWKGFPYPEKGWRYQQQTMQELDAAGLIWYPRTQDGEYDLTKRPQLKRYLDEMEGGVMGTVWTDIPPINSQAQEKLGYPTQKPEPLLERIIKASSNKGDTVLDPFCGCGTAIAVAERLHRRWVGIDVTHLAITLIRHRLKNAFQSDLAPYEIIGAPVDVGGAEALALQSRHDFQVWALGLVDARPAGGVAKKGADKGVDGYIYFIDDRTNKAKKVLVQVKSGGVKRSDIATLKSDTEREKAEMAVFITLEEPTKPMREEAAVAGFYIPPNAPGHRVPKVQLVTIAELLSGVQVQLPRLAPVDTFKKAVRQRKTELTQGSLTFHAED